MEKVDMTVEDNPQGRDPADESETHGQKPRHQSVGEQPPERIHDDRVFRFRSGIRQ